MMTGGHRWLSGWVLAVAVILFLFVPVPAVALDVVLMLTMISIVLILFMSVFVLADGNSRMTAILEKAVTLILSLCMLFFAMATRLFFIQENSGDVLDAFGSYAVQGNVMQGWCKWLFFYAATFGLILVGRYLVNKIPHVGPDNSLRILIRRFVVYMVFVVGFVLINLLGFMLMNLFIGHSDVSLRDLFIFTSKSTICLGMFFQGVAFWLSIATLFLIGAVKRSITHTT